MSKTLVNLFGWVPVVGMSLKVGYISSRALEIVNGNKIDLSKAEMHGEELEKHISDLSAQAYEEYLKPEVDNLGIPEFATNKVSSKAIDIIAKKLKEKYTQKAI